MSTLLFDPQEHNPELSHIFSAVEQEVEENLQNFPHWIGFCHVFWAEKKRILKEKYGIDWKTPAEMNPYVCFD